MAHHGHSAPDEPQGNAVLEPQAPDASVTPGVGATLYLVIAYRFGWTNGHWYHVYIGTSREVALARAEAEALDRAGKYGVEVLEFDESGERPREIDYFPSFREETCAAHNHLNDFHAKVGQFIDDAARGRALLPDPVQPQYLTYQSVGELPKFLTDEVERRRQVLKMWLKHDEPKSEVKS